MTNKQFEKTGESFSCRLFTDEDAVILSWRDSHNGNRIYEFEISSKKGLYTNTVIYNSTLDYLVGSHDKGGIIVGIGQLILEKFEEPNELPDHLKTNIAKLVRILKLESLVK